MNPDYYGNEEYCLAYECPLPDVPPELLTLCEALGDDCSTCSHRCS